MPTSNPTKASSSEVNSFHENSDADGSTTAKHHTLGPGAAQASPGNHLHDGGSSKLLLDGISLTGSKSGGGALVSVINALVTLGAIDNTTA